MDNDKQNDGEFKKPILIGKIGKLPRKINKSTLNEVQQPNKLVNVEDNDQNDEPDEKEINQQPSKQNTDNPLPYKEPVWSGLPEENYGFEVLKSGQIIENIDLSHKSFWVFGRLGNCDMIMAHPTISRYHAILQYRSQEEENFPKGFYLYDLGSTHGTFLNKNRLKSRVYMRVQVGHMIKLGCSSRTYILTGPKSDEEDESELTVTELKQKRLDEIKAKEDAKQALILQEQIDQEERERLEEEKGIDWGMGEDADELVDLSENPYAQTNNEELYLEDPKKALRGFMEREGVDFEYICTEQGLGQFLCKVELPVDDDNGRPVIAEVIHKGKKKEAVAQCALEACRILDRYGLLRQATHPSRKRKAKNWEENDFYDSDEDTFLDRTGTIEKKREIRMKAKATSQSVETYESLLEKEKSISAQIRDIEKKLKEANSDQGQNNSNDNEDSLDSFMKELNKNKLDKYKISKLKIELNQMKKEYNNVLKLVNIAKPTDLPPLKPFYETESSAANNMIKEQKGLPIYGKRMKFKIQIPEPKDNKNVAGNDDDDEEMDEVKIESDSTNESCLCSHLRDLNKLFNGNKDLANIKRIIAKEEDRLRKSKRFLNGAKRIQLLLEENKLDQNAIDYENFNKTLNSYLQSLETSFNIENEAALNIEKQIEEVDKILNIEREAAEDTKVNVIEKNRELEENDDDEQSAVSNKILDEEKRKKRNQRRIQQRQEKLEIQKSKGYDEDALKEDYNMWVPPKNQTGDGRTSLNDKLGY